MAMIQFTEAQRQAIETVGSSVIVSAAAGSGKTAVLAERCAYLVCDAPLPYRCNVNELLVLTFTEAAAAEMRQRIVSAIRDRARQRSDDRRLDEQAALMDAAQISTIHAFCLWMVRRWFSLLEIDPSASVMDQEESKLLRKEVLDGLFSELYAGERRGDALLGTVSAEQEKPAGDSLAGRFMTLVDHYGLGNDRGIATFVLKLFEFARSLPAPDAWLDESVSRLSERRDEVVAALIDGLRAELQAQLQYCTQALARLETGPAAGAAYVQQIRDYQQALQSWADKISGGTEAFDEIRGEINDFTFSRKRGPKLDDRADETLRAAHEAAKTARMDIKERLFDQRLKKRFGLFSLDEWIDGLKRTAPYAATLADLVKAFGRVYGDQKRRLGVLDFADLERFAFDLLHEPSGGQGPTEVARTLHRRFKHVLVDEFQDINPVQEAILRLVSHESDPGRCGNLFVVGDVKQSIYRFRLAEPRVFVDRLERSGGPEHDANGAAIFLQENFRSTPSILDAVNLVFSRIMQGTFGPADIVYDDKAALRPGVSKTNDGPAAPVELHVLERRVISDQSEDGEADEEASPEPQRDDLDRGVPILSDPARWQPIEREAFLIGSKINEWISSGRVLVAGRPLQYRDIAILLRTTKVNAERMAQMLAAMSVPAFAALSGSLFSALEVREVMAALQVLDNLQQDIPLAAVLRSGVMGESLSDDELVEVRCRDRDLPFHAAVLEYAERGPEPGLRGRLHRLIGRMNRYRDDARRRPLAEVLWQLLEEQGYLGYACGLPNGPQRRANLLKLHELARKFGAFRRQGLHRFLRFVESLADEGEQVGLAPPVGEAEDVVRIISVHRAKGLEFPVVFVAGLGTEFNLGDRSGRMIFERRSGIGLKVVDPARMLEYPSAVHRLVADEVEQSTRAEELRILYVAMTRAQERLVLVGTQKELAARNASLGGDAPSALSIARARTPLDWLFPALASAPAGAVSGLAKDRVAQPLFDVHLHDAEEIAQWEVEGAGDPQEQAVRRAVAARKPLPAGEPTAPDDPQVQRVLARMAFTYPHAAVTSVHATMAASGVEGAFDYSRREWDGPAQVFDADAFSIPPSKYVVSETAAPTHRGIVMHRVLQHLDFSAARDAGGVAAEMNRLLEAGIIAEQEEPLVDRAALEWFVATPLGQAIRAAGDAYRREFPFIGAEPPSLFDPLAGGGPEDFVLVRGIADGLLPAGDGMELVDYKTDVIGPDELDGRVAHYRPQMTLYARALSRIFRRPVARAWLVFLHLRNVCGVERPGDAGAAGSP